jgi:hypothetical protein
LVTTIGRNTSRWPAAKSKNHRRSSNRLSKTGELERSHLLRPPSRQPDRALPTGT